MTKRQIFLAGFQNVVDYWPNAVPLFLTGQAAFAKDDKTGVNLHIEKPDEVASVAGETSL